jgi:hypothetical protein
MRNCQCRPRKRALGDSFANDGKRTRELFLLPLEGGGELRDLWLGGLQRSSAVMRCERTL